jgi:hypothetical protein
LDLVFKPVLRRRIILMILLHQNDAAPALQHWLKLD